jgi:hypothetical protein
MRPSEQILTEYESWGNETEDGKPMTEQVRNHLARR